jgi:hypothetical protein
MIGVALLLGLLLVLWLGARPTAERFAKAHDLVLDEHARTLVQHTLRHTYRGRVVGALAGAACAVLVTRIGGLASLVVPATLVGVLSGTLVGIAAAQHRRGHPRGTIRIASLDARSIEDYAPNHSAVRLWCGAAGCVAAVLTVFASPFALGPYRTPLLVALLGVALVPLARRIERRIVEAPREDVDADVDHALRTAAVRAVHHATLGVLACGIGLAAVVGFASRTSMVVVSGDRVLFRAPPASTSLSASRSPFTGSAVQVTWIEANGSRHERWISDPGGARVTSTGSHLSGFLARSFPWLGLGATVLALFEWRKAAGAWRTRDRRRLHRTRDRPAGVTA